MKDGKCPKCGAEEVYGGVDVFPKAGPFGSNSIPISITSIAPVDNYVCAECGYLERYIEDADKLREIRRKWKKVGTVANESTK